LGVSAIYLNPIFESKSNHRYDTADYFKIDSLLGDEKDLQKLIEILNQNEMRIILDGVFSHVGKNSRYFNFDGEYGTEIGAYQNKESRYYSWFKFDEHKNYKSWWGIDDLPEIDKENRCYQEFIYGDIDSVLAKWNKFNIDGWRLDVADELPDEFIRGIRLNLESYSEKILIGEVWEDASQKISHDKRRDYVLGGMLHACMNYPFRELILNLLNKNLEPREVARNLTVLQENYPRDIFYNNFNNLGTHDTERILTMFGGEQGKLATAVGLLFILPGVPCIYYGDEVGLTGGKDPDNRKYYPWGHENHEIYRFYKKWTKIRNTSKVLSTDSDMFCFYTKDLLGIIRHDNQGYCLYVVNVQNFIIKINPDELIFTRHSPLSYEKLKSMLLDVEIKAGDNYFLKEHGSFE